jgi:hypothetical protein
MMRDALTTSDQVIDALGGTAEAGRIVGQSIATVCNWRARKRIPPEHFLIVSKALKTIGRAVSPEVFGMTDAQNASCEGRDRSATTGEGGGSFGP